MVETLQGLHPKDAEAQWIQCDGCDDKWCSVHHLHVFECPCPGIEDCLFPEDDSKGFNPYIEFDPLLKIE